MFDNDEWEQVSSSHAGRQEFRLSTRGFPAMVSFYPSKFDSRSLRHGSYIDLMNLLPKWKANLWMCSTEIIDGHDPILLLRSQASLWMEEVRTVQLHRFIIDMPGYTAFRKFRKKASDFMTPTNKSFEDSVLRFGFSLARYMAADGDAGWVESHENF